MASTKRTWKLQEFVAHAGDVNCLALGHKSGRVMVTGGDDKKVNMWAIGKPNCALSLSGHTSPVEAVRFGNAEEMVVAGSMSGALKIWDLEAAKIMRTLTGHKSNIRCLDFHPYGDFVASGSKDTNIKLWDIRRKGCIFTYKGHSNTVNSLRFSPDGRWIASAGEDGMLKLWDLAAGKLLHNFQHHTGPVTTIEFHPNEFLLASGSADRTVKYWDLESFDLVGTTDPDSTGVRCIFFHPEASALYSGGVDTLRIHGWEPARCFDALSLGWGRVADIAIAQNQLIGASFSQTNISTFVVEIQRFPPLCTGSSSSSSTASDPLSPPVTNSAVHHRRSFSERPPTQSTKQAPVVRSSSKGPAPSTKRRNSRAALPKEEPSEDGGATAAEDDEQSNIDVSKDFQEVFQTRHRLAHSPTRLAEPFPAPPDNDGAPTPAPSQPPPSKPPPSKPQPASSNGGRKESPPERKKPSPPPAEPNKEVKKDPPAKKESAPAKKESPPSSARKATKTPAAPSPITRKDSPPRKQQQPKQKDGLDPDDFLPKAAMPAISRGGGGGGTAMSETEAISSIVKGHDSMMAVMHSRSKNMQIVRALWTAGNTKTAMDSAIGMNDAAIIVDLLNVLNTKPALWNLDMCSTMVPQISSIVSSKYESYVTTALSGLRLVLKNFATVIKSNITAPPSVGVDITREERYHKCKACYKHLMDIRSELSMKQHSASQAPLIREINLLMSQLD